MHVMSAIGAAFQDGGEFFNLLAAGKLLCGRGGGWRWRPAEEGGGGFQKWASVPGPLFCIRTVVATKGAGTQTLLRKIFFNQKFSPTYV